MSYITLTLLLLISEKFYKTIFITFKIKSLFY